MLNLRLSEESRRSISLTPLVNRLQRPTAHIKRAIGDQVRRGFGLNFSRQRAGTGRAWQPLARSTQEQRRRQGFAARRPILRRTGGYRSTFINADDPLHYENFRITSRGWRLEFGSDDIRDTTLQLGRPSRNIPGRLVVDLARDAEKGVLDTIDFLFMRLGP